VWCEKGLGSVDLDSKISTKYGGMRWDKPMSSVLKAEQEDKEPEKDPA